MSINNELVRHSKFYIGRNLKKVLFTLHNRPRKMIKLSPIKMKRRE